MPVNASSLSCLNVMRTVAETLPIHVWPLDYASANVPDFIAPGQCHEP